MRLENCVLPPELTLKTVMEFAVIGGKVGAKFALNMGCPGSGSVVDFIEAGYDVYNGNYIGAALNLCSGVYDLCTLGLYGMAKEAAKGSAKQASVNMAKQLSKTTTKKIGQETAMKISQGAPKQIAIEMSKISADRAKKEIGSRLGKDLASGFLSDVTEEAFKQTSANLALKKAGMSFLGNGGKNLGNAVFEGTMEGIIKEYSGEAGRKVVSSSFGGVGKNAAKSVAISYYKDEFMRDFAFNSGKGLIDRYCL